MQTKGPVSCSGFQDTQTEHQQAKCSVSRELGLLVPGWCSQKCQLMCGRTCNQSLEIQASQYHPNLPLAVDVTLRTRGTNIPHASMHTKYKDRGRACVPRPPAGPLFENSAPCCLCSLCPITLLGDISSRSYRSQRSSGS